MKPFPSIFQIYIVIICLPMLLVHFSCYFGKWRRLHVSHLYWSSNLEVFVDVWLSLEKSIGEFSMVYKKWVLWCGLGPIITILASNYNIVVQLFKVCLEDSGYAFVSRASCDKSAKKWYLMHMYISWLCPFNTMS